MEPTNILGMAADAFFLHNTMLPTTPASPWENKQKKKKAKPKPKKNQVWVAVPPAISSHHFMHSTTFKNKPPLAAATITRSSNSALFAPSPLSLFAFAIMSKCPKKESLTICNNTRRKSAPVPRKKEKKNNGASDNNDDEQWQGQWWWECCCLKPSQPGPTLAGRGST